jgi:hypothetical protein
MSFYELQQPTIWVEPPSTWSNSILNELEACPRRWQLLNSRWGDFAQFPVRFHPAATEGRIVHEALDRLTRACGQRGNPTFGSPEFAAALNDAEFVPGIIRAMTEWQRVLAEHPRPGPPFRLRTTADELANRAVRLFREQYKPAEEPLSPGAGATSNTVTDLCVLLSLKRVLSEVRLNHPSLPFVGIIDRVQCAADGIEILDFKTGKPNEGHRVQLFRYALLWWRQTGEAPVRVRAQYLDAAESWPVDLEALERVEDALTEMIPTVTHALRAHPAPARASADCRSCPVRARCSEGWAVSELESLGNPRTDVEVVVSARIGSTGFLAQSLTQNEIAVVYEAPMAKLLPTIAKGQTLRILGGIWNAQRAELEVKPWTEVYVVALPE